MATIKTHKKRRNFTVVDNDVLRCSKLSFKATGLYAYLAMLPDGWEAHLSHLTKCKTDGRDGVRAAIAELEAIGCLIKKVERNANGTFKSVGWDFYEEPQPVSDFPNTVKPNTAQPNTENPTLLNTYKEVKTVKAVNKELQTNPIADPRTETPQATPVAVGGDLVNFPTENQTPTQQPEPTPPYDPQHAMPVPGHTPKQIPPETYETVAAISGRIGTTGIPQAKYMRELTGMVETIGTARIVQIVDDCIDDIQTANNAWAYIIAVIKNNKTPKPKKNKCPECGTMGLRNKQNLKNYGAGRVAARWVGVAHYECPKCKYREAKGNAPIVSSTPDRAHFDQITQAAFA